MASFLQAKLYSPHILIILDNVSYNVFYLDCLKNMKVLIVEDSEELRKSITRALKGSGFVVDGTGDGKEGFWRAKENNYDVIILDIMLPNMDGKEIVTQLRQSNVQTPILFLTALDSLSDKVSGLRLGADDYLVKSFAIEELIARVEVLGRRSHQKIQSTLTVDDLILDRSGKTATRSNIELTLSPQSYLLLEYLMLRQGEVITRSEIEEKIYDEQISPMSNVVETAIYTLRKSIDTCKINQKACTPLIHTRRGIGYVLKVNQEN